MFKGVNVCVYVGEGLRCSFATPDPFVLTNKICLNQGKSFRDMKCAVYDGERKFKPQLCTLGVLGTSACHIFNQK